MAASHLSLTDELANIRAEIARLQQRESRLQALAEDLPTIPVFRRGWPIQRTAAKATLSA